MKWHEISFIRFSSNYSLCNTLNVKLPKSTVQVSLKLLKHSLYCCTFSIFICEKYRIRIPYILLTKCIHKTNKQSKKIKKLWPSVFSVRTERNISFIRYNASYKLTHSSYLVYILPTQIEGYFFFSPNYF